MSVLLGSVWRDGETKGGYSLWVQEGSEKYSIFEEKNKKKVGKKSTVFLYFV